MWRPEEKNVGNACCLLQASSTLFFNTRPFSNPGVSNWIKPAVHQAPGILSLSPQHWDHKHLSPHSAFYESAGIELVSSWLHYEHIKD